MKLSLIRVVPQEGTTVCTMYRMNGPGILKFAVVAGVCFRAWRFLSADRHVADWVVFYGSRGRGLV